nr:luciferase-mApple fusion protein [AAV expression vector pTR-UF50-BC]
MEDAKNIKKGPAPFYPLEDGTAGEQLHKAMKRYALVPGTIAFTDAHIEVDITYAEYFEMSVRLAEAMKRYGLNTNHRIVVCSENSLQFFMPVLGALFIGVAVAPANDIYNERELLNSMGISQPTVVFVSKKGLQKILNVQKKLPIIQKIIIMDSKTDYQGFQSMYTFVTSHLPPGFNEYDFVPESFDRDKTIALIMNSSGSTGLPKGVALPHRTACVRFSHARDPIFGNQIIPDTAILSVVPFHHGFGMFTTLGYLICGFRVVLMYRFEEELFLRSLQDYKIQSALLVPTLFSFFAKSTLIDKYDLSNLHEIASGGAPLSKEVGEAVAKRFHLPGIRQGYGLTETTSAILITPEGDDKPGAVGKVVPFFEAKVVDLDTGKTLGVNQRGELCVRGPMIMSGYVNNPEATNALIDKDGWLHSGDIAYWDEDEHFFIVDRLKSLIKYKGYQVAPAELESILLQHPNIFDAGVAGLPDDDAGELPAAVVVLEHGKTMTEKEIVDYVASQVTTAKKLRGGVVFVDEVPKGLTGKLDARKIREILIKAKKGGKIAVRAKRAPVKQTLNFDLLKLAGDVESNPGPMVSKGEENNMAIIKEFMRFKVHMEGSVNGHEFEIEGEGEGRPYEAFQTAKLKVTKGGPLPFAWDILSPQFMYGSKVYIKHPADIPDYFKLSFPEGFRWERVMNFEDGGIIHVNQDSSLQDGVFIYKVKLRGTNFPSDGPVMQKKTMGWEASEERMYPEDGALKSEIKKRLKLKDGGHYAAEVKTTYKAKKPVQLPGAYIVDIKLDIVSHNEDYTIVEQYERAEGRHSTGGMDELYK